VRTASLDGKVAVVTGGASGIGLGIAERLARDGARVVIFDLSGDDAADAAAKIGADGGTAIGVAVDVADRTAIDRGVEEVHERFGPVAILVNNAGREGFAPFLSISQETWDGIIAVNLTGTFHCCQAMLPDMLSAGWGRIVNISSSSTHGGQPLMTHYVASKSGVVGLTKSLALEFAPKGVTVNTIPPGFIDTPMARRAEARGDLPSIDAVAARTPVRRAGTPDDIAAACAYLCSEEAGYVTGQALNVNGGWYL